ncbi:hypothetical protein LTS10_004593 [Elasticomyces elasticus]|nr:hypothetical protein LTS10_004593 [Elasticomyces elasticus]
MQEFILARKVYLCYAGVRIPYALSRVEDSISSALGGESMHIERFVLYLRRYDETRTALAKTKLTEQSPMDLLSVVHASAHASTTGSRDRVFGLLGLVAPGESGQIRSSYDVSVADLYAEATLASIHYAGTLDALYLAGTPNATFDSIFKKLDESLVGLASWAADFRRAQELHSNRTHLDGMLPHFVGIRGIPVRGLWDERERVMSGKQPTYLAPPLARHVRRSEVQGGLCIDTLELGDVTAIVRVSPDPDSTEVLNVVALLMKTLEDLSDDSFNIGFTMRPSRANSAECKLKARELTTRRPWSLKWLIAASFRMWSELTDIEWLSLDGRFRGEVEHLRNHSDVESRGLIDHVDVGSTTELDVEGKLAQHSEDYSLWSFTRYAIAGLTQTAAFFVTSRGLIGLASSKARIGDRVVYIPGATLPLLLRQATCDSHGKPYWNFSSFVYTNGITYCELVDFVNRAEGRELRDVLRKSTLV